MQLYIIRHAQSENNALWRRTRSEEGRTADPLLTPVGQQQAQILADFLARNHPTAKSDELDGQNVYSFGITHLYTSLMQRAIATADTIAKALDLPLVAWEDIHEWWGIYLTDGDTGEPVGLPGPNRAYFSKHYPRLMLPDSLGEGGWWSRPAEPPDQVPKRASRVLHDLMARHGQSEDRVAIVTHAGFFHSLLGVLLELPTPNESLGEPMKVRFGCNNAAITRIDFLEDRFSLVYVNRVDFLSRNLIT